MALQAQNLAMVGLGILRDSPPNPEQPPLVDGIHLRWGFRRDLGFPWHGFYLFRRLHIPGVRICLSSDTQDWRIVTPTRIDTPYGRFESDSELLPGFSPGFQEFDLSNRERLRFSLLNGQPARRVEALIGFHADPSLPPPQRHCVTFRGRPLSFGPNPRIEQAFTDPSLPILDGTLSFGPNARIEQGVKFEVKDDKGRPVEFTKTLTWETDAGNIGPDQIGLRFGNVLEITLPAPAAAVELTIMHIYPPVLIEAFNDDGTSKGLVGMNDSTEGPDVVRLTGPAITRIVVHAPGEPFSGENTYLLDLCYEVMAHPVGEIELTGISHQVRFATTKARGFAGQIVSASLEFDAITAVEFSSGAAGLIDICFVPVSQDATSGWQTIEGFTYPMCLPVADVPNYPCETKPASEPQARDLALSRIVYGEPDQGASDTFSELHLELQVLVADGPHEGSMASLFIENIEAVADPPQPGDRLPVMPFQSPLDMVLLGALHPAIAQMVGLYWADKTAVENVAYDYLLAADYDGNFSPRFQRSTLGSFVQGDSFADFQDIEGYIVFNLKKAPATPLAAPADVRVHSLPGAGIPSGRSGLGDASNNAGLTWNLALTRDDEVLPGAPFIYHVWRASLGNGEAPTPPERYELITRNEPVAVTTLPRTFLIVGPDVVPLPAPAPGRSTEWPPFRLNFIDRGLDEGWYGYQVSGIDIFGRHSPNSESANWFQWRSRPEPAPWYYQNPPGDLVVHPSAIRLLDKMPPPPPTAIEAYALDPADPMLVKDAAYVKWQQALSGSSWYQNLSAAEKNTLIGLRVRWEWSESHMRQAPDIREFRVYFQSDPMNAILGRTGAVSLISPTESFVNTSIASSRPQDSFIGATLQTGTGAFSILASTATGAPGFRVKNIGLVHSVGEIALTAGSPVVKGTNTSWHGELAGMVLQVEDEPTGYRILRVDSPSHLTLQLNYQGPAASGRRYRIYKAPLADADCTVLTPDLVASGRVSVAKGSNIVSGSGSDWSAALIGTTIRFEGRPAVYSIGAVNSTTELVLDRSYEEETGRGKNYTLTHRLFVDYTRSTSWQERRFVVGFDEHVKPGATPFRNPSGRDLTGERATIASIFGEVGGDPITSEPAREPRGARAVVSLVRSPDPSLDPDLSGVKSKAEEHLEPVFLFLENDAASFSRAYKILKVDETARTVTVEGAPSIGLGSPWIIGVPVRKYELFLPDPAGSAIEALPLITSSNNPIAYASIGVSSADVRTHTGDSLKWASSRWGNRFGNEGRVGAPVKVFRVHREPPPPPSLPSPLEERVFATRADYHGRSFYTFRWMPMGGLKTLVCRALDDSVFKTDWLIRSTRGELMPNLPQHDAFFPKHDPLPDGPPWDDDRKQAAADQLNAMNSPASYAGLSLSSRIVLARLPGNQGFTWREGTADPTEGLSLQERDWQIRSSRLSLGAGDAEFFPENWNDALREQAAIQIRNMTSILFGDAASLSDKANRRVTLDGNRNLSSVVAHRDTLWLRGSSAATTRRYNITNVDAATRALTLDEVPDIPEATSAWAIFFDEYRDLSDSALRVLAGLPGNDSAFSQVTTTPLDPSEHDPENVSRLRWQNRRGPDDADSFTVGDATKPLANPALLAYTDVLDGKSDNRYFYRAAFADGAHNQSVLGPPSPPVYLPHLAPPSKPRVLSVLGGDRRVILQWESIRETGLQRYLIYRTEDKVKSRDTRSMGGPVASLPARPLVSAGQEVDLGAGADIVLAEQVYEAAGFDPSSDLLNGQTVGGYLFVPVEATGTRIADRLIPDATEVVVVYRDSHQGLQYTPWKDAPRGWTDEGLVSGRPYYYRVVASRKEETATGFALLYSEPSDVAVGQTVDLNPPDPPVWSQAAWVLLRDSDGGEEPWPADGVIVAGKRPAIRLVWTTDALAESFVVSRRARDESAWRPIAVEAAYTQIAPTDYLLYDADVSSDGNYNYRVGSVTADGVRSLTLREVAIASP